IIIIMCCFNPRAPWGARPFDEVFRFKPVKFQSTRPVGGATLIDLETGLSQTVSIHAPRGGRDCGVRII
ncbi:MAG: hypothetical protein RR888_09980, partial [Akkermansia sp.]